MTDPGDLLADEFDHECNGYLMGVNSLWLPIGFAGWIGHSLRTGDVEYSVEDGGEATYDRKRIRVIRVRLVINSDLDPTLDDAWAAARALEAAWVSPDEDVELHALLPAPDGHVKVIGRCGDLEFDEITEEAVEAGELQCQAEFRATNPQIVSVP